MNLVDWWIDYRIRRLNRRIEKLLAKCRRLDAQGKDHFLPAEKLMTAYAVRDELVSRRELRRE